MQELHADGLLFEPQIFQMGVQDAEQHLGIRRRRGDSSVI